MKIKGEKLVKMPQEYLPRGAAARRKFWHDLTVKELRKYGYIVAPTKKNVIKEVYKFKQALEWRYGNDERLSLWALDWLAYHLWDCLDE